MKIVAKVTLKQLLTEEEKAWMQSLTEFEQWKLIEKFRKQTEEAIKKDIVNDSNIEFEVKAALHK